MNIKSNCFPERKHKQKLTFPFIGIYENNDGEALVIFFFSLKKGIVLHDSMLNNDLFIDIDSILHELCITIDDFVPFKGKLELFFQ